MHGGTGQGDAHGPASFDHVIVTRFSAVFGAGQPPPDEDWLHYRLGFFADATCASLGRQSGSPRFRWLVFVDDRSPDWFRDEVERLANGLFEPVWTHDVFSAQLLAGEIAARSDAPFLITTRLDSDDAVATGFVAAVQAEFDRQQLLYVNFPLGYQLDRAGAVYVYRYPVNPFISLVERRTDAPPRTVFINPRHTQSQTVAPVREVKAAGMWLQVVHGSNVANGIRGRRVSPHAVNAAFDIDLPYRTEVPRCTVAREALVQAGRIVRGWSKERWLARQWAEATLDRLRGTHTKPRSTHRR